MGRVVESVQLFLILYIHEQKKEEIWLSPMTKAFYANWSSKTQSVNTRTPPKTSITQRLQTDFNKDGQLG